MIKITTESVYAQFEKNDELLKQLDINLNDLTNRIRLVEEFLKTHLMFLCPSHITYFLFSLEV